MKVKIIPQEAFQEAVLLIRLGPYEPLAPIWPPDAPVWLWIKEREIDDYRRDS